MFAGKRVLISGGSGSWGNELTKQLLDKNVREIIIYSRGELAQVNMQRKFFNDHRLKFVIGDVRDLNALQAALKNVDYVYHLAALKHVPVCELQVSEAIKTNINGTQNIVTASIDNKVKKFILVSTDKAVDPTNLYGMTKAVAEKIVINSNLLTNETDLVVVRAGNVLGSNGSVVPYFIEQIKKQNKITITNPRMTRFFLTLSEAINLLFQATENAQRGEIWVTKMPSYSISSLALALKRKYGKENTDLMVIGAKAGEKVHEVLISETEAKRAYIENDNFYFIMSDLIHKYDNMCKKRVDFETYHSNQSPTINVNMCQEMLAKAGY